MVMLVGNQNRTSPIGEKVPIQVHWTRSHLRDPEQHSDLCQTGIYFHTQKVPKPLGGAANSSLCCELQSTSQPVPPRLLIIAANPGIRVTKCKAEFNRKEPIASWQSHSLRTASRAPVRLVIGPVCFACIYANIKSL